MRRLLLCAACLLAASPPAPAALDGAAFDGSGPSERWPAFKLTRRPAPPAALSRGGVEQAPLVRIGGSSMRLLVDGAAFEQASLETIASARFSLELEMFDFFNERLIRALAARARDVPVRIVLDPFPGRDLQELAHKRRVVALARAAGADVVFYPTSRLHGAPFKIDHVKLLIADGARAVAGGENWGEDLRASHDFNLLLEGPVVSRLQEVFARDYMLSAGLPPPPRTPPSYEPGGSIQVLVTGARRREPLEALLRLLAKARRVRAEELLLDEPRVVDALIAAKARGADIELLLDPNSFFFGGVNEPVARRLLAAGVPVRFFHDPSGAQRLLHAKLAVFDGRTVLVGSANWSRNALEVNHELALLFSDRAVAARLEAVFDADWAGRSSAVPPARRGLAGLLRALASALARPFS